MWEIQFHLCPTSSRALGEESKGDICFVLISDSILASARAYHHYAGVALGSTPSTEFETARSEETFALLD